MLKKTLLAATLMGLLPQAQAQDIDNANWMGQLYADRANTKLKDILIPGTHDSGTYSITKDSAVSSDAEWYVGIDKKTSADWSATVEHSIYDQLQNGIRWFDWRIWETNGKLSGVHGLVGADLTEMLADVKRFAAEHPKEIIFISTEKLPYGWQEIKDMLDVYDIYIKDRQPDNNIPFDELTLAQLWAEDSNDGVPNNVIAYFNGPDGSYLGREWGYYERDHQTGGYSNQTEAAPMLSHNKSLVENWDHETMLYTAFTLTPVGGEIVTDVLNPFGGGIDGGSLLSWTQDKIRAGLADTIASWNQINHGMNLVIADFPQWTSIVPASLRENTVAPAVPTAKLEIMQAPGSTLVWNDYGSGGNYDASVWSPNTVDGYYVMYNKVSSGYSDSTTQFIVKGDQPGVVKPLGYQWIWGDNGSDADMSISVWRGIAPKGYVCLGDIAKAAHGKAPSTDAMRCIHESYTVQVDDRDWRWSTGGMGSDYDGSIRDSKSADPSVQNTGAMIANSTYGEPAKPLFRQLVKAKLQYPASSGMAISALQTGSTYKFKLRATANNCMMEFAGGSGNLSGGERNAKFDCNSSGDTMYFTPTSNGVSVTGNFFTVDSRGERCNLQWDGSLSGGERNAKFDCEGGVDPMTLIGSSTASVTIRSDNNCGLEWAGGSSAERNAKFDCNPNYDAFALDSIEDLGSTSAAGSWASSGGRNATATATGNKRYTLTVFDNGGVTVNLTSGSDTYMYLLNSSGSVIASDDDGGSGYNSKISTSLSAGTYTVVAATYSTGVSDSFALTSSAAASSLQAQ